MSYRLTLPESISSTTHHAALGCRRIICITISASSGKPNLSMMKFIAASFGLISLLVLTALTPSTISCSTPNNSLALSHGASISGKIPRLPKYTESALLSDISPFKSCCKTIDRALCLSLNRLMRPLKSTTPLETMAPAVNGWESKTES